MHEIDEDFSDEFMAHVLGSHFVMTTKTLAQLSGHPASDPPYETDIIRDIEIAWDTPLSRLTCRQVHDLVGQQFGLEWLAAPVAVFVRLYPAAICEFYSGDLTLAMLRAHEKFFQFAPAQMQDFLRCDLHGLSEYLDFDEGELLAEASTLLNKARTLAGLSQANSRRH